MVYRKQGTMADIDPAQACEDAPYTHPLAAASVSLLTATSPGTAAAALRTALQAHGMATDAVAWRQHDRLVFEPASADIPAHRKTAEAALAGHGPAADTQPHTRLLRARAGDGVAALFPAQGAPAIPDAMTERRLALAGQRLYE